MKKKFILLPITLTALAPTMSMVGCNNADNPETEDWFNINKIDFDALPWPKIYYEFTVNIDSLTQKRRSGSLVDIYIIKKINNKLWTVEINASFDHDDIVTVTSNNKTYELYFTFDHKSKHYSLTDKQ